MIVPRTRLLAWVAVVVIPFGMAIAVTPHAWPVALAVFAGLMIVAIADASISLRILDPITLRLPAVLRVSKDRPAALPFQLANENGIAPPTLRSGSPADLCICDPSEAWTVRREALRSQGKNTPFLGIELLGRVRYTLLAGQVVHESSNRQ